MDKYWTRSRELTACLLLLVAVTVRCAARNRHHRHMSDDMIKAMTYLAQYHYIGLNNPDPYSASLIDTDPEEATRQGIQLFQSRYGLDVTGTLTSETLALMSKPRCGMPDINNMEQTMSKRRKKRFAVQGGTWKQNVVTYRITSYPADGDLSPAQVDLELKRAFGVWEAVTPLRFIQKKRHQPVDIDIKFAESDHGDGFAFDGPGGVLAHAFYPQYGGDAHFDEAETWTINSYQGTNLFLVAAHEFGHALGLAHSEDQSALMAPFYAGYMPDFTLPEDDINGIQQLYGPPKHGGKPSTQKPAVHPKPTSPVREDRPAHKPKICTDGVFDAITTHKEGEHKNTYGFRDDIYVMIVNNVIAPGYPRPIRGDWPGLPDRLDAALFWDAEYRSYWKWNEERQKYDLEKEQTKPARTYFFKGDLYWRFENRVLIRGYPRNIASWGLPRDIDAAFVWSGNGKTYFTKGGKYYRYTKGQGVDSGYPRPLSVWKGLPDTVHAAFQYSNGKTYFFNGPNYYRFLDDEFKIEQGYPRQNAVWWLGCKTYSRMEKVTSVSTAVSVKTHRHTWLSILTAVTLLIIYRHTHLSGLL